MFVAGDIPKKPISRFVIVTFASSVCLLALIDATATDTTTSVSKTDINFTERNRPPDYRGAAAGVISTSRSLFPSLSSNRCMNGG